MPISQTSFFFPVVTDPVVDTRGIHLQRNDEFKLEPWFHGSIDRKHAEEILGNLYTTIKSSKRVAKETSPIGGYLLAPKLKVVFLVRESQKVPEKFMLSFL